MQEPSRSAGFATDCNFRKNEDRRRRGKEIRQHERPRASCPHHTVWPQRCPINPLVHPFIARAIRITPDQQPISQTVLNDERGTRTRKRIAAPPFVGCPDRLALNPSCQDTGPQPDRATNLHARYPASSECPTCVLS